MNNEYIFTIDVNDKPGNKKLDQFEGRVERLNKNEVKLQIDVEGLDREKLLDYKKLAASVDPKMTIQMEYEYDKKSIDVMKKDISNLGELKLHIEKGNATAVEQYIKQTIEKLSKGIEAGINPNELIKDYKFAMDVIAQYVESKDISPVSDKTFAKLQEVAEQIQGFDKKYTGDTKSSLDTIITRRTEEYKSMISDFEDDMKRLSKMGAVEFTGEPIDGSKIKEYIKDYVRLIKLSGELKKSNLDTQISQVNDNATLKEKVEAIKGLANEARITAEEIEKINKAIASGDTSQDLKEQLGLLQNLYERQLTAYNNLLPSNQQERATFAQNYLPDDWQNWTINNKEFNVAITEAAAEFRRQIGHAFQEATANLGEDLIKSLGIDKLHFEPGIIFGDEMEEFVEKLFDASIKTGEAIEKAGKEAKEFADEFTKAEEDATKSSKKLGDQAKETGEKTKDANDKASASADEHSEKVKKQALSVEELSQKLERLKQLQNTLDRMEVAPFFGDDDTARASRVEELARQYIQTLEEINRIENSGESQEIIKQKIGLLSTLASKQMEAMNASIPTGVDRNEYLKSAVNFDFGTDEAVNALNKVKKRAREFADDVKRDFSNIGMEMYQRFPDVDRGRLLNSARTNVSALEELVDVMERIMNASKGASQGTDDLSDSLKKNADAAEGAADAEKKEEQATQSGTDATNEKTEADKKAAQATEEKAQAEKEAADAAEKRAEAEKQITAATEEHEGTVKEGSTPTQQTAPQLDKEQHDEATSTLDSEVESREELSEEIKEETQLTQEETDASKENRQGHEEASSSQKSESDSRENLTNAIKEQQETTEAETTSSKENQQAHEESTSSQQAESESRQKTTDQVKEQQQATDEETSSSKENAAQHESSAGSQQTESESRGKLTDQIKEQTAATEGETSASQENKAEHESAASSQQEETDSRQKLGDETKEQAQSTEADTNAIKENQAEHSNTADSLKEEGSARDTNTDKTKEGTAAIEADTAAADENAKAHKEMHDAKEQSNTKTSSTGAGLTSGDVETLKGLVATLEGITTSAAGAAAKKDELATAEKALSTETGLSTVRLNAEVNALDSVRRAADGAARAKERFISSNQTLANQSRDSSEALNKEATELKEVAAATQVKAVAAKLPTSNAGLIVDKEAVFSAYDSYDAKGAATYDTDRYNKITAALAADNPDYNKIAKLIETGNDAVDAAIRKREDLEGRLAKANERIKALEAKGIATFDADSYAKLQKSLDKVDTSATKQTVTALENAITQTEKDYEKTYRELYDSTLKRYEEMQQNEFYQKSDKLSGLAAKVKVSPNDGGVLNDFIQELDVVKKKIEESESLLISYRHVLEDGLNLSNVINGDSHLTEKFKPQLDQLEEQLGTMELNPELVTKAFEGLKDLSQSVDNELTQLGSSVVSIMAEIDSLTKQRSEYMKNVKLLGSADSSDDSNYKDIAASVEQYESRLKTVREAVAGINRTWDENNESVKKANAALDDYENKIKNISRTDITKNAQGMIDSIDRALQQKGAGGLTKAYTDQLDELKGKMQEAIRYVNNLGDQPIDTSKVRAFFSAFEEGKATIKGASDQINKLATQSQLEGLLSKINDDIAKGANSGVLGREYADLKVQVESALNEIKNCTDASEVLSKIDFQNFANLQKDLHNSAIESGALKGSMVSKMADAINNQSAQFLATYFSFQDIIRYTKEITNAVVQTDSALTELKKVSDESNERIQQSFKKSAETAQELGNTITNVINSTSDWARLNILGLTCGDAC